MGKRWKNVSVRVFYLAFSLCFLRVVLRIASGGYYGYGVLAGPLCAAAALGLLLGLCRLIRRREARLEGRAVLLSALLPAGMLVLQLTMAALLRYRPVFDVDAVFGGAREWAETGSFPSYYAYYAWFPNNFGSMELLHGAFRLARAFGLRDDYMTASAVNALFAGVTMFAAGAAARRRFGTAGQMTVYAFFLVSPPFYFLAPAFYTDALSMPFPALILWLYLLAKDEERRSRRLVLYVLLGMAAAFGVRLKPTVGIALIAVTLDGLLTWDWKKTAALVGAAALLLAASQAEMSWSMYRHVDRQTSEMNRTPLLHWVMMGLGSDGLYDPWAYEFTRSYDDPAERNAALREEIGARLKNLGAEGLAELQLEKADICFGDGTWGLSDCLGGEPERDSRLRELLLPGGRYNRLYRHICGGVLLGIYGLMIAAGLQGAFSPNGNGGLGPAPYLAVFGLLLFLSWWEARWRYFSGYIPVIYLAAVPGAEPLSRRLKRAFRRLTG